MADQPALVTHCKQCEERVHANRHIKSVNGRFYAICYDCSGEDDGQEPEQKQLVTDGGYDVAIITDDFVRATAAPAQEAESWVHVEIDDPTEEASGYWFPCRLPRSGVGDDRDAVPDPDQLAHDDVLQFPLETRQPELAGGALPPQGTKDRVVEDPLDDYLPQGGDA